VPYKARQGVFYNARLHPTRASRFLPNERYEYCAVADVAIERSDSKLGCITVDLKRRASTVRGSFF
jgi:hypothetical protein